MRHIKRVGEQYYFGKSGEEIEVGCIFKIKNLPFERIFHSDYIMVSEEMILEVLELVTSNVHQKHSDLIKVKILFTMGKEFSDGETRKTDWIDKSHLTGSIRLWRHYMDRKVYMPLDSAEKELVEVFKSSHKFGI